MSPVAQFVRRSCERCPARATARCPAFPPAGCSAAPRLSPLMVSAAIGLRLCGIADEPFCPGLKSFATFVDLRPLEVAELDGDHLHRRADRSARPQVLGVAVPRDDLRRRDRHEPETLGHEPLDGRIDVRVRADRSTQLAHPDRRLRPGSRRGPGRPGGPTARPCSRTSSAPHGRRASGRSSPCRGGSRASATSTSIRSSAAATRTSAASRSIQHRAVSTTSLLVRP